MRVLQLEFFFCKGSGLLGARKVSLAGAMEENTAKEGFNQCGLGLWV